MGVRPRRIGAVRSDLGTTSPGPSFAGKEGRQSAAATGRTHGSGGGTVAARPAVPAGPAPAGSARAATCGTRPPSAKPVATGMPPDGRPLARSLALHVRYTGHRLTDLRHQGPARRLAGRTRRTPGQ